MPLRPADSLRSCTRVGLVVSGLVQGVGFRRFVFRLARAHGLAGHVFNAGDGVRIEVEGGVDRVAAFLAAIPGQAPAQARIDAIDRTDLPAKGEADFAVLETTQAAQPGLRVPPDLATCPDCVAELLDPRNRRYHDPFMGCSACGPRFSILHSMPYDRHRTAMRGFSPCPACRAEYAAPQDRRFLAELTACPDCGPRLTLQDANGTLLAEAGAALAAVVAEIAAGRIAAVKGIGGYHLLADAASDAAVARLRRCKRRPGKPLALMAPHLEAARSVCHLSPADATLLQSAAAPIVLAPRRLDAPVSALVAPDCTDLGVMLPYAPVYHLLMHGLDRPVVVTSGNRNGEPIQFDDHGARRGLRGKTDRFLGHDCPIRRPVDDAVVRTIAGAPQVLRLGRGLAPDALPVPMAAGPNGPTILALGGDHEIAPVLLHGHEAILGPHVGDVGTVAAEAAFCRALEDLQTLHQRRAAVLACDLHPDYPATHLAQSLGLPVVQVQHQAAHIASVMAEHDLTGPIVGFAWDRSGYGPDGTIWGGETLAVSADGWHRLARLRPFPLPGGERAVHEPRLALCGLLHAAGRPDLLPPGLLTAREADQMAKLLAAGLNTPVCSSAGCLFNALAALLGLGTVDRHEGEAAMRLERCASTAGRETAARPYPYGLRVDKRSGLLELDWQPMVLAIAWDLGCGVAAGKIALAANETLATMIAALACRLQAPIVALSGECFQNRLLLERCLALLGQNGRRVCINRRVPPGDGGLALGQALLARWHLNAGG